MHGASSCQPAFLRSPTWLQVAYELSKLPPMSYLQVSQKPWEGGILNMDKVIARYRELLPPRFEDLGTDFAVGVYTRDGKYRVIDSGPLPEAVVASAAIPFVFEHVDVPGVGQCMDGGKHDRVGLTGWSARERRRGKVRFTHSVCTECGMGCTHYKHNTLCGVVRTHDCNASSRQPRMWSQLCRARCLPVQRR